MGPRSHLPTPAVCLRSGPRQGASDWGVAESQEHFIYGQTFELLMVKRHPAFFQPLKKNVKPTHSLRDLYRKSQWSDLASGPGSLPTAVLQKGLQGFLEPPKIQ